MFVFRTFRGLTCLSDLGVVLGLVGLVCFCVFGFDALFGFFVGGLLPWVGVADLSFGLFG